MDDRRLKEYAFKIYSGDSDYSLQKAFRLFPKYFSKIAFYYTEILVQKQKELNTRMFQALGIDVAVKIKKIVDRTYEKVDKFRTKAINDIRKLDEYEKMVLSFEDKNIIKFLFPGIRKKEKEILTDINNVGQALSDSFRSVVQIADYFGFNDIFKEAARGLVDSKNLILELSDAIKLIKKGVI